MNDLIGPICLDAWRESISGRKNAQGAGELAALLPPALCPGSVHPTNFSAALKIGLIFDAPKLTQPQICFNLLVHIHNLSIIAT